MITAERLAEMKEQLEGDVKILEQSRANYRKGLNKDVLFQMIKGSNITEKKGNNSAVDLCLEVLEQLGFLDEGNIKAILEFAYNLPLINFNK